MNEQDKLIEEWEKNDLEDYENFKRFEDEWYEIVEESNEL